jgi:MoaA/NifB/PqqE/SkfB family radical SAM enzyme
MNALEFVASGLINAPKNLIYRAINKPLNPRLLVIMTTDRCNSRCKQCNIWQQKPTENPLTPAEIGTALLSPVFNDVKQIILTGGECTLRDDLYEIILYIKIALPTANIIISTNGLLPDRVIRLVARLKELGHCISVGTSLDGTGKSHDEIRGVPGNFNKVDTLLKALPDTDKSVGFVLSELTVENLKYVRGYLKQFGLNRLCSGAMTGISTVKIMSHL